jgi:hypothetical protein
VVEMAGAGLLAWLRPSRFCGSVRARGVWSGVGRGECKRRLETEWCYLVNWDESALCVGVRCGCYLLRANMSRTSSIQKAKEGDSGCCDCCGCSLGNVWSCCDVVGELESIIAQLG